MSNSNKMDIEPEDKARLEEQKRKEELETYIECMKAEAETLSVDQIKQRIRAAESNLSHFKGEINKMNVDIKKFNSRIKENKDKLKLQIKLPHLVATVHEIFDMEEVEKYDEGSGVRNEDEEIDKDEKRSCAIVKTSLRGTFFLPVLGIVDADEIKPLELVGINKDTYLIYEPLPPEYDPRVQAMELDEKPKEQYTDIGGLDKQIQELEEAVVLPIEKRELFDAIGITPPKGVLLYGPPGTGKTMMARACAARCKSNFLKLAGSQLVQQYIGEGAKIVRDAFKLAKEKAPSIIFIDEIDSIGIKRSGSESSSKEVQRTMLELLNQLDGFDSNETVKVVAATNRPDVLDPALLRSGRLDRKIEFPMPNEEGRVKILEIHSQKMNFDKNKVNFKEMAKATDDFNGAMLKAVAVEAGMLALRRGANEVCHEDFVEGINQVKSKKKTKLEYFS